MGIRICCCDLYSRRWGFGGDKIAMDFGSSLDSECVNFLFLVFCIVGILRLVCACFVVRVCGRVVGGRFI